jgi:putative hydrolase of the HAD superfamily
MTTAIFFELDGTIVQRSTDEHPLRTVFEAEVGDVDEAWVDRFDEHVETYHAEMAENPHERALADVCEQFGLDAEPARLAEQLVDERLAAETVSDDARESLRKLGSKNELGVLTDDSLKLTDRRLDRHDLAGQFEAVVTAADAGARKPDGAPFELARERLPAEEYVLVGPDYERDIEGARAAGFVPIHYEDGDGPDFWATLNALV